MLFSIQPVLENENVKLVPLQETDFEQLYSVASDPLVWEQHPNKDRYKKDVFKTFFEGAILSQGAFIIYDKKSNEVAGSTRFYAYNENDNSIFIGYTFYARKFWGSKLNPQVKKLMLDYILQYVDLVKFHVGKDNIRSRKAMEKLGAELKGEVPVAYFGEAPKLNVEYWILKEK
jgi:RimJ/RimL family protein N-acetyltransferase